MKRTLIACIFGLAASIATTSGQANFFFDTFNASAGPPQGVVTWTTDSSLAPVGLAGTAVADAQGFKADLLWTVGTATGDLGLAVPTSTVPAAGSGWIIGGTVSFYNNYISQPIDFTIRVWQGASYASATALGSISWTERAVIPGDAPGYFQDLPNAPIVVSLTPEPTTLALAGLGAALWLTRRRRS